MKRDIILILHNIRSTHNVGSLLRTSDAMAVSQVIFSGYTPYPKQPNDSRLPYLIDKLTNQISKTALGAENTVKTRVVEDIDKLIIDLKKDDFQIVALEQSAESIDIKDFKPTNKVALILGNEVQGIDQSLLDKADAISEIPMLGSKESLNVSVAGAIGLYVIRIAE